MKAWSDLSDAGRIQRLRPLARSALEHFDIQPTRLRLVGGFTNVIFRVETSERPYALRIDLHQDHSDHDVENELGWLAALAAETDLDVARCVPARSGRSYVYAGAPGVPRQRRCVLFEWIPGRPLDDYMTEDNYRRYGRLAAGLHQHGSAFRPPHPALTWDRVFYWPETVDPVVIFAPDFAHHLAGGRRQILDQTMERLELAFARLPANQAQTIHGDLHPSNVHVFRKRIIAFDFEDVTWGHRVQDVATTLFYGRDVPAYVDLRTAFREGYTSRLPWPETYPGEIEHFMAARTVMFINYVANLRSDPSGYYEVAFPRLSKFLANWGG